MNEIKEFTKDFVDIKKLSGDAGLRRYYRLFYKGGETKILMDCSCDVKTIEKFLLSSKFFKENSLPVPEIYQSSEKFILLEDLGEKTLEDVGSKMPKILNLLSLWQKNLKNKSADFLAPHDFNLLREELSRFELWFIPYFLKREFSPEEKKLFNQDCLSIIKNIENQEKTIIHRDFHSRNLMQRKNGEIVLIDYQDALNGYITYDLVSITRDCYLDHSDNYLTWEEDFRKNNYPQIAPKDWQLNCNFSSIQRHLKVLGLFVRLAVQENKSRYLADLPLVFKYTQQEVADLKEFLPFIHQLFTEKLEKLSFS